MGHDTWVEIEKLKDKIAKLEDEKARLRFALEWIINDFDPDKQKGPPCGPEALKIAKTVLTETS